MTALPFAPLAYQPSFEQWEDGESDVGRQLVEQMHKISTIVHADEGHAYRSVHAKGHGVLVA
ncbi:MAG: catalase, partial [Gammaproteobacteria bacterium]|nr:catalase [Gammaproteobacteria bacterium]